MHCLEFLVLLPGSWLQCSVEGRRLYPSEMPTPGYHLFAKKPSSKTTMDGESEKRLENLEI